MPIASYVCGALTLLALLLWPTPVVGADDGARYAVERRRMVDEIAATAKSTRRDTGRASLNERVMAAMNKVERHRFVAANQAGAAYRDHPLPIGSGQTISQPFIVALSTDLIDPQPKHVVLEIGTGSGYQAAVLAELVGHVYSIEIVEALGREAAERLAGLGYRNVDVRIGDGYRGWPEHAPFDGIIVTATAPSVPAPLIAQLKPGGRMVIPAGLPGEQQLILLEKDVGGSVSTREIFAVMFSLLDDTERS